MSDLDACRALLRAGSRSFWSASRLLPGRVRDDATALYAFCRVADDRVDHGRDPANGLRQVSQRLDAIYRGRPDEDPVDRAFASVVESARIPRAVVELLLEGFAWDAGHRTYVRLPDLRAYAVRVAATVGVMMTLAMGRRSPRVLARACDLGVAMQLTNIARDVGEDARAGRIYLPLDWLRELGVSPDALLGGPVFSPGLGRAVARLLSVADRLYLRARAGVALLPRDCRVAIRAAGLIYAEIGQEIRRAGYDTVSRRAITSGARKLALLARSVDALAIRPTAEDAAPLPEAEGLIAAVEVVG